MTDFSKILLSSQQSSNKILLKGTGVINVASLPGAGETQTTATIPHGYSSSELLFQVGIAFNLDNDFVIPWQSNDGRLAMYASIDSTNLYITVISSDTSGFGATNYVLPYTYVILIP